MKLGGLLIHFIVLQNLSGPLSVKAIGISNGFSTVPFPGDIPTIPAAYHTS